jgi:hypothetical protein
MTIYFDCLYILKGGDFILPMEEHEAELTHSIWGWGIIFAEFVRGY